MNSGAISHIYIKKVNFGLPKNLSGCFCFKSKKEITKIMFKFCSNEKFCAEPLLVFKSLKS